MICTIDLGSNSFRVLIYDCKNHKIIKDYHEIVGMADGLNETKLISKEAQERVEQAVKRSIKKLNYKAQEAVCVTTAAMRLATNSKEVLKNFKDKLGLDFTIITGEEEARLTLLAVKYALKRENITSKKFIVLDIGGGSTELIISNEKESISYSFDFGIVTLTQKNLLEKDLNIFLEKRKDEVKKFLLKNSINPETYTFVATAGTPTTIAAIKNGENYFSYDKNVVNGTYVNLEDLDNCLDIFKKDSKENITKLVGKGRVDFVEIGTYIYKSFFEVLNKKESLVFDDGLREGVAINECLKLKKT